MDVCFCSVINWIWLEKVSNVSYSHAPNCICKSSVVLEFCQIQGQCERKYVTRKCKRESEVEVKEEWQK